MAPLKLYHFPVSGPSRAALFAARAIGVPIQVEIVDITKKDHLKEGFLKINPMHVVPTLQDGDFVLCESRAIMVYLADKYGRDDSIYPQNLTKRAVVNQRLFFDATTLYVKIWDICGPILLHGMSSIQTHQKEDLDTALGHLDKFLSESKFVAGDHYTIADCSIYASLSSILAVGCEFCKFPNIQRWVKDCAVIPGYDENNEGADKFGEAVKSRIKHKH